MRESAPLSVVFYLSSTDAALFRLLHAARVGADYVPERHDKLIAAGLLEVDEFNPQPDGTRLDDVVLTDAGQRELARLHGVARETFERKRREARAPAPSTSTTTERRA